MVTYCLRRVIPACIPLTLFISEATVLIFELPDLAPSVLNRFSSLVASVTNCMSLPSIWVVMDSAFTPAIDRMSFESFTCHLPFDVLPFSVSVKVPSFLKVIENSPGLIPYFVSCSCNFASTLLAAIFDAAFARILSEVKTIAGSE